MTGPRDDRATHSEAYQLPSELLAARLRECLNTIPMPGGGKYTLETLAAYVRAATKSPQRPDGVGTKQYMSRILSGTVAPEQNDEVLRALAAAFGKAPDYFVAIGDDSELLAERLRKCLDTIEKPGGGLYTVSELAAHVRTATRSPRRPTGLGSRRALVKLLDGEVGGHSAVAPKPNADVLRALAAAFGKPPGYFLASSRDESEAQAAQVDVYLALKEAGVTALAARHLHDAGFARAPTQSPDHAPPPAADAVALRRLAAALRGVTPTQGRNEANTPPDETR